MDKQIFDEKENIPDFSKIQKLSKPPGLQPSYNSSNTSNILQQVMAKKGKAKPKQPKATGNSVRAGDWVCLICNNLNFSFRNDCNRCGMQSKKQNYIQSLLLMTESQKLEAQKMIQQQAEKGQFLQTNGGILQNGTQLPGGGSLQISSQSFERPPLKDLTNIAGMNVNSDSEAKENLKIDPEYVQKALQEVKCQLNLQQQIHIQQTLLNTKNEATSGISQENINLQSNKAKGNKMSSDSQSTSTEDDMTSQNKGKSTTAANILNNNSIQKQISNSVNNNSHFSNGKNIRSEFNEFSPNYGFENAILLTPPRMKQNLAQNISRFEDTDSNTKRFPPYKSPKELPSISPMLRKVASTDIANKQDHNNNLRFLSNRLIFEDQEGNTTNNYNNNINNGNNARKSSVDDYKIEQISTFERTTSCQIDSQHHDYFNLDEINSYINESFQDDNAILKTPAPHAIPQPQTPNQFKQQQKQQSISTEGRRSVNSSHSNEDLTSQTPPGIQMPNNGYSVQVSSFTPYEHQQPTHNQTSQIPPVSQFSTSPDSNITSPQQQQSNQYDVSKQHPLFFMGNNPTGLINTMIQDFQAARQSSQSSQEDYKYHEDISSNNILPSPPGKSHSMTSLNPMDSIQNMTEIASQNIAIQNQNATTSPNDKNLSTNHIQKPSSSNNKRQVTSHKKKNAVSSSMGIIATPNEPVNNNPNKKMMMSSEEDPKKRGGKKEKKSDWICPRCGNLNYSFRKVCNRCQVVKQCDIIDPQL